MLSEKLAVLLRMEYGYDLILYFPSRKKKRSYKKKEIVNSQAVSETAGLCDCRARPPSYFLISRYKALKMTVQ